MMTTTVGDLFHGASFLGQGAEAKVYRIQDYTIGSEGEVVKTAIVKERFAKRYRHPELDRTITAQRTRSEAKNIARAIRAGIPAPRVYFVDKRAARIIMEDVGTRSVKALLWADHTATAATGRPYSNAARECCAELGRVVAMLHDADIVHGDLTTSNFMVRTDAPFVLAPIDFGLSFGSASVEDKAVDLYVLERAFLCTHLESDALVAAALDSYAVTSFPFKSQSVLRRLEQVRQRGRKKIAFG
jgi:TP53 regulating kinase-like protein